MRLAGVECITSGTEFWALTTIPKTDGCYLGENTFISLLHGAPLVLHFGFARLRHPQSKIGSVQPFSSQRRTTLWTTLFAESACGKSV